MGAQRKGLHPDGAGGIGEGLTFFLEAKILARDGEGEGSQQRGSWPAMGPTKNLASPGRGVRSLKCSFDTVFLSSGELPRAATERAFHG